MKGFLLILFIVMPLASARAENAINWYVGLHLNENKSMLLDQETDYSGDTTSNIDNGDTKKKSLSITGGAEIVNNIFGSDSIKLMFAGEVFFDNIGKTVVQGNDPKKWYSLIVPRPMANQPIYKSKYLTGIRGKFGFQLFKRVDIYGHFGWAYWDRDWYLDVDDRYIVATKDPNWKVVRTYGFGGTAHITDHWAANINYTIAKQDLHIGLDRSGNSYQYIDPNIAVNILTAGVVYYF
ncbi:MAG: outer membrane beta-barrel protein [Rickettsiales bacterium]|jgi:hypothetical protein|nr:outer membrane beta-barrel protein [Rickettsiales bacterium]